VTPSVTTALTPQAGAKLLEDSIRDPQGQLWRKKQRFHYRHTQKKHSNSADRAFRLGSGGLTERLNKKRTKKEMGERISIFGLAIFSGFFGGL